jgi:predicted MFS family arabinose efflux permease
MRLVAMDPALAPITLSLNASAGYIGVSIGAVLGSFVVAHDALTGLGWVAAGCELTAFGILVYTLRRHRSSDRTTAVASDDSELEGTPSIIHSS